MSDKPKRGRPRKPVVEPESYDTPTRPYKDQEKGERKRGGPSNEEIAYIAENQSMGAARIAEDIGRSLNFVKKIMDKLPEIQKKSDNKGWIRRLRASSSWTDIKRGLIGYEIPYFEAAWASYMDQFASSSDIVATDELMIRDLIMMDILSQRAVNEKADILKRITKLNESIAEEEKKSGADRNEALLANWRGQLSALHAAKTALSKEHIDYQTKKDTKLRDLKGSRDQRFKQIEESRRNIFELIKDLDSHNRRLNEGRLAEKVRIAADKVQDEWGQVTEYDDGTFDKPFLSPEGEMKDAESESDSE